jgi:glycosyltransferase involved in cell wall biosynthesis
MYWITALPILLLLITLINFFTIRNPATSSDIDEFVSVIVPLRNEAANVELLIESLKNQRALHNVEFILLDDNSDDETLELITREASGISNFHIIEGKALPSGWIGKVWALQQLLAASRGEIIVSIDADVRLKSDALSKSITLMKSTSLDFISPYPRQIAKSFSERLIQPLLQWSWMSTLPLRISERASFSSMAVANGQFFIVRTNALKIAGGYESVKSAVLDDIFLARRLIDSGSHGVVVSGTDIAECRMYSSWSQIQAGYGKSLRHAFGSPVGSIFAVVSLFLGGIAPVMLAIMGSAWGLLAYLLIVTSRFFSAIKSGSRLIESFLHPLSSALLIYLIAYSYFKHGAIQWKGRTV